MGSARAEVRTYSPSLHTATTLHFAVDASLNSLTTAVYLCSKTIIRRSKSDFLDSVSCVHRCNAAHTWGSAAARKHTKVVPFLPLHNKGVVGVALTYAHLRHTRSDVIVGRVVSSSSALHAVTLGHVAPFAFVAS